MAEMIEINRIVFVEPINGEILYICENFHHGKRLIKR
jgi:hypothetical protein